MDLERFRWEGTQVLEPGKHSVVLDFKRDVDPGFGQGGSGVLNVDGKDVASETMPHIIRLTATADETFDIGVDTRASVDDRDNQPPLRFIGKIEKLTFKPIPLVITAAKHKVIQQEAQAAKNRAQ